MGGAVGLGLKDPRRAAVLALLFASGAAALAAELCWMRLLSGVVGGSHAASSLVLAVFMAGLALGAWIAGPRLDRTRSALAAYGRIEIGVGLWTLALPLLAGLAEQAYLAVRPESAASEALTRLAVSVALLLVPTTLMGATLPAVVKTIGRERPAAAAGTAYASNVLGAVAGALLGGLVLLPRAGVTLTGSIAGAVSIGAGLIALALARRPTRVEPERDARRRTRARSAPHRALVVAAIGGASALALEVIWMRALSILTADTTLAQTATLAGYLLGLALGGRLAAARVERVRNAWPLYALCQLAIAAYALASPVLLELVAERLGWRSGTERSVATELALASAFFLLPASLSGASLTLLFRVALRAFGELGANTGRIVAANSLGATSGALMAGLYFVPRFGTQLALLVAAGLSMLAALIAQTARTPKKSRQGLIEGAGFVGVGVVLALGVWALGRDRFALFGSSPPGTEIVFAREDAYGLVEVRRSPSGELSLITDRRNSWGSTHPLMLESMREQGLLPLVLHENPRSVIEIGIGSGVSFAPVLKDARVEHAALVEISPAVVDAARLFAPHNEDLHHHPKLELSIGDGRHHLLTTDRRYDVIVLGLFTPYRAGAGQLFSQDLYRACRARLAPGGLLVHWLPLDQLPPAALASVISAFASELSVVHAFDRVQYVALVGSETPIRVDPGRRSEAERRSVLASHLFGRAEALELARGVPPNTDDRPFVEFHPADVDALRARRLAIENLEALLALRRRPEELLAGDAQRLAGVERAWLGRESLIRGGIAQARGAHTEAERHFTEALAQNPDDRLARSQLAAYRRR